MSRRLLACAAATAIALAATQHRGGAAGTCLPRWRIVAHAGVPDLADVAAVASRDVWAVGSDARSRPVVVHWDGERLSTLRPLRERGRLEAVAAASAGDVWAVGSVGAGVGRPVAVHWDGRRWKIATLPHRVQGARLTDVAAIDPADAWAVGEVDGRPLILHWNGQAWSSADLGNVAPPASRLNAVVAASSDDVWAAGVDGLDAVSSYGYTDLVMRWDGRRWARVPSPLAREASGPFARAVAIAPSRDVWTMNQDLSANEPWFVHWHGVTRRAADVSRWDGASVQPADMAVLSARDLWLVGTRYERQGSYDLRPLVAHGNGATWSIRATPFDRLSGATLASVVAHGTNEVWAAGRGLLVRFSC